MNNDGLINICIFIGGCSVEHEISLISGLQAILNLDKSIYNPFVVYLSKDNEFIYLKDLNTIDYFKEGHHLKKKANCYFIRKNNSTYLVYKRKHFKIDICFPVVHGKGVEDGNLSGYINLLKLSNVCSNVLSSSIAQDKGGRFCDSNNSFHSVFEVVARSERNVWVFVSHYSLCFNYNCYSCGIEKERRVVRSNCYV